MQTPYATPIIEKYSKQLSRIASELEEIAACLEGSTDTTFVEDASYAAAGDPPNFTESSHLRQGTVLASWNLISVDSYTDMQLDLIIQETDDHLNRLTNPSQKRFLVIRMYTLLAERLDRIRRRIPL